MSEKFWICIAIMIGLILTISPVLSLSVTTGLTGLSDPTLMADAPGEWQIKNVTGSRTIGYLYTMGNSMATPPSENIFLIVGFELSRGENALPLDVQKIVLGTADGIEIQPSGGSISFSSNYNWVVGNSPEDFRGNFSADRIYLKGRMTPVGGPSPNTGPVKDIGIELPGSAAAFAYVVPRDMLRTKTPVECRLIVRGFDEESFTVDPLPLPQGVPAICSYGSFVAATHGKNLYFFNTSKNTPAWTFNSTSTLRNPFISQDAALVLVEESETDDVYVFDRSSPEARRVFPGDNATFEAVSANGRHIAFSTTGEGGGHSIVVADTLSGEQIMVLKDSPSGDTSFFMVNDIDMSEDGSAIALAAHPGIPKEKGIFFYENSSPEPAWIRTLDNFFTDVESVSVSPDGSSVATSYIISEPPEEAGGAWNYTTVIELLGSTNPSPLWTYTYTTADSLPPGYKLEFSQNGDILLAWNTTTILLFEESGSAPLWSATFPGEHITDAAMAYDGDPIVVATREDNVYLYNRSGELQWTLNGTGSRIALTTLGNRLAVSSRSTLTLLEIDEPVPLWTFTYPYP